MLVRPRDNTLSVDGDDSSSKIASVDEVEVTKKVPPGPATICCRSMLFAKLVPVAICAAVRNELTAPAASVVSKSDTVNDPDVLRPAFVSVNYAVSGPSVITGGSFVPVIVTVTV